MRSPLAEMLENLIGAWQFRRFERSINSDTWRIHDSVLRWAEECVAQADICEAPEKYEASEDPLVRQGYRLAQEVRRGYFNKHASSQGIRVLVHLPEARISAGGHSVFSNLAQSLQFLGIPVLALGGGRPTGDVLAEFRPTILLISDYRPFLALVDWAAVKSYRSRNKLLLGLTASLEAYGNTPLPPRLSWAREHGVDFYFTFRSQNYVTARREYTPFFDMGYRILSFEFGVNPLVYYPVPGVARDLNFVFLASSNRDKLPRYVRFLGELLGKYPGIIDGPGWPRINNYAFNSSRDRYLYARARVGINLHLEEQIEWACELNERTYMLAACGTPQLVDNPKLLHEYFSRDALFVASSPREYLDIFEGLVANPCSGVEAALKAQQEVFAKYTTFHRADRFVVSLNSLMSDPCWAG